MRKLSTLLLLSLGLVGAVSLSGCNGSSGNDAGLETAAPAPKADAKPEAGMANKNRPGDNAGAEKATN